MADPSTAGQLTHGFLFADLRGYTAFAEARGDVAAADLLDRYRTLVRAVIAEMAGAEIRTEGDSFYVVFPSASRAVAAGLAIVDGAAAASLSDPTRPIRVGVGIHAGEAEERAEGYVGTAVNTAARVCAQARPGEVLVTETVRALTRTSGRYRFISRGRPRLKGLAEPIALYAVQDVSATATARNVLGNRTWPASPTRLAALAWLAGAAAIVGVLAILLLARPSPATPASQAPARSSDPASGAAASTASPSSAPRPFVGGPLAAATYQTGTFAPPIRLTVPAGAWNLARELPNELDLTPAGDDSAHVLVFRPDVAYVPCSNTETLALGRRADDVIAFLQHNRALVVGPPVATRLGDTDATMLEIALGSGCGEVAEQRVFQIWAIPGATLQSDADDVTLRTLPDRRLRVYVTEFGGQAIVIAIDARPAAFDDLEKSARSLLSTLEFAQ